MEIIPNTTKLTIIGEPTDLNIINGQKGLITLKLICKGKSAHGSTPKKGINAIELLVESLSKLKKISFEKKEDLGESSLNIGIISGGNASNVVPDYAEATIEIRNTVNPEIVLEKIKGELKNTEIRIINSYEPILNKEAENIAKDLGLKTKIVPYFTEMYFFNKKSKTIVLGAGLDEDAHSKNEKVKINDFKKLIEVYLKILEKYTK
jgi:acetylornithine deacetylase/succinyl-diaminopimelate desuccinylase-like protein